jgi:DeoR sensor domain-containing protein
VLLDAGSTVGALAHELRSVPGLMAVTVGLTALPEFGHAESVTVHCLGGTLRPLSESFVGPLAEAALERVTFDRAYLGADGVTADGLCEADLAQTRLKELMARRAGAVYVLAHGAKLERRPFHAWARLDADHGCERGTGVRRPAPERWDHGGDRRSGGARRVLHPKRTHTDLPRTNRRPGGPDADSNEATPQSVFIPARDRRS